MRQQVVGLGNRRMAVEIGWGGTDEPAIGRQRGDQPSNGIDGPDMDDDVPTVGGQYIGMVGQFERDRGLRVQTREILRDWSDIFPAQG